MYKTAGCTEHQDASAGQFLFGRAAEHVAAASA